MNQLGLLIGVGIAAAAGEGRPWRSDFRQPCQTECPYCALAFFGHASRELIL
jgi:hypothetical protein